MKEGKYSMGSTDNFEKWISYFGPTNYSEGLALMAVVKDEWSEGPYTAIESKGRRFIRKDGQQALMLLSPYAKKTFLSMYAEFESERYWRRNPYQPRLAVPVVVVATAAPAAPAATLEKFFED